MNDPAQQEEPKDSGENELDDGYDEPALEQLTKSRNEETAERGDDVASGSLSGHMLSWSWSPKCT